MLFIKRKSSTAKQVTGDSAEDAALAHLTAQGLRLVQRNYRANSAKELGEIDLIMRDGPTLVFVEVRARQSGRFGGAAASVTAAKQRKLIRAAQHYLQQSGGIGQSVACRFDVVALQGAEPSRELAWIRAAFHA